MVDKAGYESFVRALEGGEAPSSAPSAPASGPVKVSPGIAHPSVLQPTDGGSDYDRFVRSLETAPEPAAAPSSTAEVTQEPPEFKRPGRPEPQPMTVAEMGSQALQNVGPSAKAYGESLIYPFTHPKETASALGTLGTGIYGRGREALGLEVTPEQKQAGASLDALGRMFKDRYGSKEAAMRTFAEDPVGFFGDASLILSGGGGLAARAPGVIGKVGEAAVATGRAVDPLTAAAAVPKVAAKGVTSAFNVPAWIHSGASFNSLQAAEKAGVTKNPTFWAHYSGQATPEDLVARVRDGIKAAAEDRSKAYIAGMKSTDATKVLPYTKIDEGLVKAQEIAMPRGAVFNPESDKIKLFQNMNRLINDWKANPANSHTIADFDFLKREIRDFGYSQTRPGSPERKMVDEVANAAKDTIVSVDRKYSDIMEEYGKASEKLREMSQMIGGRSADTKVNKLLKGYKTGSRSNLLDDLYKKDPDLLYAIAGHDLSTWLPQGLRGTLTTLGITGGSFLGGGLGALLHPGHLVHGAMLSPKIVGGVNYGVGRAAGLPARVVEKLPAGTTPAIEELGRMQEIQTNPQSTFQKRGGRVGRATGGRTKSGMSADQLIAAAERAKKEHGKSTEVLLDEPDEHITRALEVAKRHL